MACSGELVSRCSVFQWLVITSSNCLFRELVSRHFTFKGLVLRAHASIPSFVLIFRQPFSCRGSSFRRIGRGARARGAARARGPVRHQVAHARVYGPPAQAARRGPEGCAAEAALARMTSMVYPCVETVPLLMFGLSMARYYVSMFCL